MNNLALIPCQGYFSRNCRTKYQIDNDFLNRVNYLKYGQPKIGIDEFHGLAGVPNQRLVLESASLMPPFGVINNGFPNSNETSFILDLLTGKKTISIGAEYWGVVVVGDNTTQRHGCDIR